MSIRLLVNKGWTRLNIRWPTVLMLLLILVLGILIVFPLTMVIYGSFKAAGPLWPSPFTLQGYQDAFTNINTYKTLGTTVWLAIVRAILCLFLAVCLAWIVTRTDTPWTKYLEVAIWMAFFLPFQPYVMAWILLAGGEKAILNVAITTLFPSIQSSPINIYSYGGIIFVAIIKFSAVVFLLITPAFRGMDASLEESSKMSGAGTFTTLRRVTLPVLAPALVAGFLFALIICMESFIIELYLGFDKGIFVYSTRVFALLGYSPADYPQAMALSTVFLAIMSLLIVMQWRMLRKKEFTTVTGRGFATRRMRLGKFRYLTLAFVLSYVFVAIVLPMITMILGSFTKSLNYFGPDWFTVNHWMNALSDTSVWRTLRTSMILGISVATLGLIVYSLISYIIVRTNLRGKNILDFISWLPWGVPSMVMALGILWGYIGVLPFRFLYGSLVLMILVLLVMQVPFGCRVMTGSLHQLAKELEESSRVSGASWFQTLRKIVAPILAPSFISAWVVILITAVKDLNSIIFLYGADTMPASVLIYQLWVSGQEMTKSVVVGVILSFIVLFFAVIGRWAGNKAGGQSSIV